MNITRDEVINKLHGKLNDGIGTLMTTKNHLTSFHKDLEATVVLQLRNAKASLNEKKQGARDALLKTEKLIEAKHEETVEAVAEWKVKRHRLKIHSS